MLRVAVVTHYFPTSIDPWAGHSAYWTLRLLARQTQLRVFYPVATYPSLLTPAHRRGEGPDPAWAPLDVDVTYIPYTAIPGVSRPLNGFTIARKLLPHVRAFQPDIVFNYVIYPNGYAACRIARTLRVPAVLTAIGSDLNRISDPLCGLLTRSALRQADLVTTVSGDLRATAIRLGADPGKTRALLNGCDTSIFHPQDRHAARGTLGLDPSAEILVYVGRLDLRKGLLELIAAVAALRVIRPEVHCYLIGDGPAKSSLIEAISSHGIASAVTLVPSCFTERVALWMGAADLVTLPSYNEGCPNVVIEALSSGRPVVATQVGGIPELMDARSGRLIPARDIPALTRALDEVLRRPWDAAEISSRHHRSWEDLADDLLVIFQQLLRRSR